MLAAQALYSFLYIVLLSLSKYLSLFQSLSQLLNRLTFARLTGTCYTELVAHRLNKLVFRTRLLFRFADFVQ